MAEPYQLPVARLWSDDGSVAGAGFLAPHGVVVTCAHVVNAALRHEQLRTAEPRGEIRLDLPWAAGKTEYRGSIVAWRPPVAPGTHRPNPCVDIAVLRLDHEPPAAATLQPQAPARVQEDTRFSVMGFPAGRDAGAGARGTVRATDADGWHLVEADRDYGQTIEPGFSGAPAIADDRRLLGMIDLTNADERRGVLIPVEALMRAWPPLAEPYRGLQAFREEDAAYFFGRDELQARLWRSFERNPVTLLTGPSGSGKSSLLNAGFLPRLRALGGWRLLRFRPGDRPMQRLGETLAKALKPQADALELVDRSIELRDKLTSDPDLLPVYARTLQDTDGARLCLIVDQFEETFTLAEPAHPEEHRAFLATLTGLATQQAPAAAKVVLALRSDFQTMLQSEPAAAELVKALDGDPTVLLRPLMPAELEQVIRGPLAADRLDVTLDDGLLAQLLHDITRNADALPLLEFALTELWAEIRIDRASRSLSRAAYDAMGGISGALARHADAALTELQLGEAETKRLFVELVRVGSSAERDTRRPRRKTELEAIDPALWPVAQRLAGRRLVVTTAGPAVDLVHEALLRQWPRLAGWIEAEREFLRWRQRLDERRREWDQAGQQADDLLAGNALDEAARWLAASAAALDEPQRTYIDASISAQAAGRCRQEADALWDRLELGWIATRIPKHELCALVDLARATPDVRHEFLLNAVTSEPRARRFGRQPQVAIRAAVGLDLALVAQACDTLVGLWRRGSPLSNEQLRASISIGVALVDETSGVLPLLLVEQVARAIPGTTNSSQLKAYGEVVRAFADRVDAETARTLVEYAVRTILHTANPSQLQAYGEVVRAFADHIDAETARTLVEQVVRAIPDTVNPSRLQNHGEVVRAVADRVDAETAHTLVEHAARTIPDTTDHDQLQVYREVVRAFANRIDAETARTLVKQVVRAVPGTVNPSQLQACGEVIRAFADRIDAETIDAAARTLVEQVACAIPYSTDPSQLQACGAVVRAFADRVDAETIDAAARTLVEQVIRAISSTVIPSRLQGYGEVIRAFADRVDAETIGAAARTLVKHAACAISSTVIPSRLQGYGEVIRAFVDRVDAETIDAAARTLVEQMVRAIPGTTNLSQLQAYGEVVHAFADRVDAETARTFVEHAVRTIPHTTNPSQLQADGELVRAFADRVDAETARTLVEQVAWTIPDTSDFDQLQAYGEVVRAFADRIDTETIDAAARTLVEHAAWAIPGIIIPSRLQAYGELVRAFADRIDAETARTLVEQVVRAIPGNVSQSRLQNYGELVRAFADRVDAETARTLVEHAVQAIHRLSGTDVFDVLLDAVLSVRSKLDPAASAYLFSELLKYPLAGRAAPTRKLIAAIGDALGLGLQPGAGLWQFLTAVAVADPSLLLAAPYTGPEAILAGFRRRLAPEPSPTRR